ncbi:hypothetical protein GALMADRAFT_229431 [Galerina marginata CBS 339.88]|uniref:Uncharacterized protein n=1 Tax=Galerina marginata (strain CBS 339.88) TaxID=685588 RepID=A0A067SN54_GALM3|nr:hypothetical protein GALMADRAFT_229431 [Galerina marginata CBS 339.88]
MSSNVPPCKSCAHIIFPKGFFKSIRRFKIFPNHVRLPTTPALITILKGRLKISLRQLSSLQDFHDAQLLFLQNLADPTTVKDNDPVYEFPLPSSILFNTRTILPLQTYALPQSYSSTPMPHTLSLP